MYGIIVLGIIIFFLIINMFKSKEDIKYGGGFYLSNGIINFKKGKPRHLL